MDRNDDRDILHKGGFAEHEVIQLRKIRKDYTEQQKHQSLIARRRLEFIRWLVLTGRLTDQIA